MKLIHMSGKSRKMDSAIEPMQKRITNWAVPRIPKFIETYHLTLLTLPLSILIIFIGKWSKFNSYLLIIHALIILTQYVSDVLDGSVGRYRNTGLVRWGFFMDHFLDFVFANSIVLSYAFAFSISIEMTAVLLFITSGFFMHEFLIGNIKGMVNTSGYFGIGPTEARFGGILFDIVIALTGFYPSAVTIFVFTSLMILVLLYLTVKTQKALWNQDMINKKNGSKNDS